MAKRKKEILLTRSDVDYLTGCGELEATHNTSIKFISRKDKRPKYKCVKK